MCLLEHDFIGTGKTRRCVGARRHATPVAMEVRTVWQQHAALKTFSIQRPPPLISHSLLKSSSPSKVVGNRKPPPRLPPLLSLDSERASHVAFVFYSLIETRLADKPKWSCGVKTQQPQWPSLALGLLHRRGELIVCMYRVVYSRE